MNKIEEAESGRHFFGQNTGCWSKIPILAGKMNTGLQITRENIVRCGAEQGRANNPLDRNELNVYSSKALYLRKISSRVIVSGTP